MVTSLALWLYVGCNLINDDLVAAPPSVPSQSGSSESGLSFSGNILPIMISRCSQCHGASSPAAGIDVTSYESLISGIDPGDPESGLFYHQIASGSMPPSGSPQLTVDEVAAIEEWILEGAENN